MIIPANNEEKAISKVLSDLPRDIINEIIVVDNCSTDNTGQVSETLGAKVLEESFPGYGSACLKGISYLKQLNSLDGNDIIAFIDGDYSDYPQYLTEIIKPIKTGNIDLVIGSRAMGKREKGSMTVPQIFGNWLATSLLKMLYSAKFTDLGPFRAIRWSTLLDLNMQDKTYGWTVEMQLKIVKQGYKYIEIPVPYRKRIGFSKISGTIKGTFLAGYKILWTIFKYL